MWVIFLFKNGVGKGGVDTLENPGGSMDEDHA